MKTSARSQVLSRRTLLAGLAAAPVLAACGARSGGPATSGAGQSSAPAGFALTDARGTKIDLDTVPTTVVAQSSAAAALWDAGFRVKGAYGELKTTDGKLDYQAGNLDLSQVAVVGQTYGDFSVEKLAAVAPELLIDLSFDNKTLWYIDAKVEKQVTALCPTLGVEMLGKNLLDVIGEFTALAVKLGADPATSAAAKADFDAAANSVKEAITAAKGARILALSCDSSSVYVANAAQHPDLAYLKTLGAQFVDAKSKPEEYFSQNSYEKLDDFDGDVVIVDARNTYTGYKEQPTWRALSAVKAGRVFAWKPAAPYSYAANVSIMGDFAKAYGSVAQ